MKKNRKYEVWHYHALKKPFLVMRIVLILSLVCIMQSFALESYTQNSKISISVKEMKLEDIMMRIEDQTQYRFAYNKTEIDVDKSYSVDINNAEIKELLEKLFLRGDVNYTIIDRQIVLSASKESSVTQQQKFISGKITDSSGVALPGVSVVVKGTTTGSITDANGNYSLTNIPSDATLSFSFIGMKSQEITIGNKTTINVVMEEETVGIEEVVAVGYGTHKKVNLTGSVGTITSEGLQARPVQNAIQMLQGLIPGLNITQSTGGSMEDSPSINIRGVATIGQGSTGSPLILIDGMEGNINAINPQDIDNVSVLKDAAASSIYGSRAPFGVILVTTKKGKKGTSVINYNNNFRWNSPIDMPNMMDSYTFATFFNDANINGGASPYISAERLQRIKDYQAGVITTTTVVNATNKAYWGSGYAYGNDNIDWYDQYYRDQAFSQEHNIGVSGGNDKLQYYFSGNYLDQNGLMVYNQDTFDRYTTTLKLSGQINDWLSVNLSNRFIREDYGRPSSLTNTFNSDLARQGWPTIPLYDPNGYVANTWVLSLRDGGRDISQKDWLYQQLQFVLEPVKGWKTTIDINSSSYNQFRHYDIQKTYLHDVSGAPYLSNTSSNVYEYAQRDNYLNSNVYSEYVKQLENGHNFKALLGFQAESQKSRNLSAKRDGIVVPSLAVLDLTSGTDATGKVVSPSVSGLYNEWSTTGFFGRLNYDYKGRYLMEMNMRYDGTSRFRSDKRWNWFPSVSAGWNIANEKFWTAMQDKVSMLKIRASYGELGNQNTSSLYPTYVTMPVGTANGSWLIGGAKPNTSSAPGLVSQSLSWERVNSWNMGLDISAFRNRLSTSFDYFNRLTIDMVGPAPELPLILGTSVPKMNNTDLKTSGFELSLAWKDRLKNGLNYGIRFLLSDSRTKITKYPNITGSLAATTYRTDMQLGEIWGYETIGIAKTQEEMDAHLATLTNGGQNAFGSRWEAGDIMYKDLNDDGKIDGGSNTLENHGDLKIIGNNTPHFLFSFDLSADWKGFDIRAFFQGVAKRDYFQNSYYFWGAYAGGIWWSTGFDEHSDYFRSSADHPLGQNLDSYYPRPLFSGKNQQTQTRYLQNAAYIRLKNLQLGYTLPRQLTSKVKIEHLRVFVAGENLWTGTNLTKIFDPETISGGYGGNVYPLSKVISVGLSTNF